MPDCSLSPPSAAPTPAGIHAGCEASLQLRFGVDGGAGVETTRLLRRTHRGPLRVQKALYPEGPAHCHVILVHPPGGVVGGDRLAIDIALAPGSRVLATTPGAAKWYRANGRPGGALSRQQVRLRIGAGSALEWLPQESIFYDGASVDLEHEVELEAGAVYIGAEVLCFGRAAMGERYTGGRLRQRTRIREQGRLLWHEQGRLDAAGLDSPLGLGGASVCATLLAVGKPVPPAVLAALRAASPGLALSQVKSVLVARHLGSDGQAARAAVLRTWQLLRPHLLGVEACVPRIWHT